MREERAKVSLEGFDHTEKEREERGRTARFEVDLRPMKLKREAAKEDILV